MNILKSKSALAALYTLTAFVGAALIFLVQPLVAKLVLPAFGGSAAVWTTSSFFFQVILLAGYILVHGLMKWNEQRQPLVHLPLLALAAFTLPIALPSFGVSENYPAFTLVKVLALMVALPFLVLSMTGPTLQKWYARTEGPRADDPYFLYAASNVGSFFGLLAYPFAIEPTLTLSAQKTFWSAGFVCFAILMALCGVTALKSKKIETLVDTRPKEKISLQTQARWISLAFVPSSLMLGVTTYLATDIASIPLLWIVPLALYLATMVFAFALTSREIPKKLALAGALAALVALELANQTLFHFGILATTVSLLFCFTLTALAAHRILAATRPEPEHLTYYFVLVSVGGALGGAFNSFIAPVIFSSPLEYPVILALAILLALFAVNFRKSVAGVVVALLAGIFIANSPSQFELERSRTFYGSYKIDSNKFATSFSHGTTLHGVQLKEKPFTPTTYYSREGALGDLFSARGFNNVTAVGLGAGTIAVYGRAGENWNFVEIDPEVVRLAEKHFSYLEDTKANVTVEVGDGRLAIEKLADKSQDLILLDAFSSDSIPVHLMTEEAAKLYKEKLTADGAIAFHISNRFFDLVPVVVADAKALGMTPLYRFYNGRDEKGENLDAATASTWMVLTNNDDLIEELEAKDWKDLSEVPPVAWTDDYSSILDVLL